MSLAADQGSPGVTFKLVVGLGNPGPRYSGTRHNAGFLVVDELARRHGANFRQGRVAATAKLPPGTLAAGALLLLKPLSFMNRSGSPVQAAMTRGNIRPSETIVVHDDIDLPLGKLRVRVGGTSGGQRGVADITRAVGTDFVRVKVGVGRPPDGWQVENWVLSRFTAGEAPLVGLVVATAADAVELTVRHGAPEAMNAVNGLDLSLPD
ncbi:MAG: aminoacyl-tRNA hydrolase [Truepera sp.]|nr:aminoacyl-tRNA hydrolase [Truepera sp.]